MIMQLRYIIRTRFFLKPSASVFIFIVFIGNFKVWLHIQMNKRLGLLIF